MRILVPHLQFIHHVMEEVSGTKACIYIKDVFYIKDCIFSVSDIFLYYATISLSQSAMTKTIQSTQTHFSLEVWIRLVLLKYFVAWRFFDNNEESSCFMGNTDSCLNSPAFRDNKLCKLSVLAAQSERTAIEKVSCRLQFVFLCLFWIFLDCMALVEWSECCG